MILDILLIGALVFFIFMFRGARKRALGAEAALRSVGEANHSLQKRIADLNGTVGEQSARLRQQDKTLLDAANRLARMGDQVR